jgi:hypothetical protein
MPPTRRCHACDATSREVQLVQLTAPAADDVGTLTLCEACLDLRETGAWGLDEPDGRRLRATLEGLDHEPAQRYAYLVEEDTRLLLVRLRPDWVAQHARPAPA